MFKGGGRDHSVGGLQGNPILLAASLKRAPSFRDRKSNRQYTIGEPKKQIVMKPIFQGGAALAGWEKRNAFVKLADADNAQKEGAL